MNTRPTANLPAEWAPQSGVLLTWPHRESDWAPMLDEVEPVFVELAREITRCEPVLIACYDSQHRAHVRQRLHGAGVTGGRALLGIAPANDTWARDHGPLIIWRGERAVLLDFRFNGWGGKHPAQLDNRVTARLHETGVFGTAAREPVDLVLEGGAIETDGQGTLLTTESCLLNRNRNPELGREDIERLLREYLGIDRVLWLRHGHLAGDDTDGHIDTLARFCDPRTIAHVACDDPNDEHFEPLQAMAAELTALRTPQGAPYRLVPLPLPRPICDAAGRRLPAGHANFLIINGAVLVPTYGDPADAVALQRLGRAFPGRRIVGVDSAPLIRQFGSLHCLTMQLPAGVLDPVASLEVC
ncbi:MAG: agmatine deiminase family protein [Gammaproteobacteria bacterium]|nr:agmatine deiminase family protein [Gammaproteobacteria bacterium]NIR98489.1 agmatine deiminase family protein [Gammaproteobacteria bacterium]NIT64233.1 agmatine deiminase family protein [Gammaproteobacteria bacterium]NIV21177.1 agmatine deiminase [Gammaproteobacteria bacterium]NIX10098.1 agmatine deiminase [Gammaproteobacteria bacterium]